MRCGYVCNWIVLKIFEQDEPEPGNYLLNEDGTPILDENGDPILLES